MLSCLHVCFVIFQGVWTLEEKGIEPNFTTTFDDAKASYAHMALVALETTGMVEYFRESLGFSYSFGFYDFK